jgi:hypothetical protein
MKSLFIKSFYFALFSIIVSYPHIVIAETVSMTAVGEYIMGDNDTYTEAKKIAFQDAKRIMLEKIGTYIESKAGGKENVVTTDEIKQYTAGIVKVEEVGEERAILENKATVVKVNIKGLVDPDSIIKQVISFRNRKDIEESANKLYIENNILKKEIDQLNQQLRIITNEEKYQLLKSKREDILKKIEANEKGLTLVLSGEGLYTAALLDRQKNEEVKEKVNDFLREIASAYKLSASPLEIQDNGDGSASVFFIVKGSLECSLGEKRYVIDRWFHDRDKNIFKDYESSTVGRRVTEIPGVNLTAIESTGLILICGVDRRDPLYISIGNLGDKICHRANDYLKESLFTSTSDECGLKLLVKLGNHEKERILANDYGYMSTLRINKNFEEPYRIDLPLSELKTLSQLELKVVYDNKMDGKDISVR